jgi:asparagine synthase (glutamine-hydrolysing)
MFESFTQIDGMRGQILGGIVRGSMASELSNRIGQHTQADRWWTCQSDNGTLFVAVRGQQVSTFISERMAIVVRGYAVPAIPGEALATSLERIGLQYRTDGILSLQGLEGSFTFLLLDGESGRVCIHRNLVHNGNTFYASRSGSVLFASNLADLTASLPDAPHPDLDVLPLFFLFRYVPGPQTLFLGVNRLMPGARLQADSSNTRVRLVETIGALRGPRDNLGDPVERLDGLLAVLASESHRRKDAVGVMLSGGVDSTLLQAHWNGAWSGEPPPPSYCVALDHPSTVEDSNYARSAATALGSQLSFVVAAEPYAKYLVEAITATGEPPNHVQAVYFLQLAKVMAGAGLSQGVCGEAADGIFGMASANYLQNAWLLRCLIPLGGLRRAAERMAVGERLERVRYYLRLADRLYDFTFLEHPVNRQAVFADWPSVTACFGDAAVADALTERRRIFEDYAVGESPLERLHAANFFTSSVDSAAFWTTMFHCHRMDLLCPFLDSRMLRFAVNLHPRVRFPFRRPKALLRRTLARHVPRSYAFRNKRGFGQPIFEWLAPGGQLRALVDDMDHYDFVPKDVLARAQERPNWFLYALLCYDLWHKKHIRRSASDVPTRLP